MEPSVAKHARQQAAVVVPACNPCWHLVYGTQHSMCHTSSGQVSCFDASSPYAGAGGDAIVGTGCMPGHCNSDTRELRPLGGSSRSLWPRVVG